MNKQRNFLTTAFTYVSVVLGVCMGFAVAAPAQAMMHWRNGVIAAKGDAGFFWMALEKGYFKQHGVDVQFIQFHGDGALTRALLAGYVDSAEVSPAKPLIAIARGANLRFFGATMPGFPYALYVRKDIKTWAQLKGKTFGVSSPGSVTDIMSRAMLAREGINPKSIKIVVAGGSAERIKALVAGKIDADASSSEYAAKAKQLGIRVMAYAADLVPQYPRYVLVANAKTLKEKRKAAIAFLAGYIQGLRYAVAHRHAALELTAKITHKPITDPDFAHVYDEAVSRHYVALNGAVPVGKIEWLQGQLLKTHRLKKPLNLNKYIDQSYQQAALKIVGAYH